MTWDWLAWCIGGCPDCFLRRVELIAEKQREGVAIPGNFRDDDVRAQVAGRIVDVTRFAV